MKATKIFLLLVLAPVWGLAVEQSHTGGRGGGDTRAFEVQDAFVSAFRKLQVQQPAAYETLLGKIEALTPQNSVTWSFYTLARRTRVVFADITNDHELKNKLAVSPLAVEVSSDRWDRVVVVHRAGWARRTSNEKENLALRAYLQAYQIEEPLQVLPSETPAEPALKQKSPRKMSDEEIVKEFKLAAKTALNVARLADRGFFSNITFSWDGWADTVFQQFMRYVVVDEPLLVPLGKVLQECAAANEREGNTIYISRPLWSALQNSRDKEALALHEVLSVIHGTESTGHYDFSLGYHLFWKWQVEESLTESTKDFSAGRSEISDYTVMKAYFHGAWGIQQEDLLHLRPQNCVGVLPGLDPQQADPVFPIDLRKFLSVPWKGVETGTDGPSSFGGIRLAEAVQVFATDSGKEVLSLRQDGESFKLETYEGSQLKTTVYGACGLFWCSKEYPTPGCLGELKELSF